MDSIGSSALIVLFGGLFPSLAWLWFWRREDSAHPEPRYVITIAFLAGMATVIAVIPLQKAVAPLLPTATIIFTVWSAIEELGKYIAARITVLWRKDNDEPIDSVIYMVAVALGFAALENALFLLSPLAGSSLAQTIITGDLRFVGATLLHILSSSIVGCALALSYYKDRVTRTWWVAGGLVIAIFFHASFNYLILHTPQAQVLRTFMIVWISLIGLMAVLEYVKRIR